MSSFECLSRVLSIIDRGCSCVPGLGGLAYFMALCKWQVKLSYYQVKATEPQDAPSLLSRSSSLILSLPPLDRWVLASLSLRVGMGRYRRYLTYLCRGKNP